MYQKSSRKKKRFIRLFSQRFHRPRLLSLVILAFILSISRACVSAQATDASSSSIASPTSSASSNDTAGGSDQPPSSIVPPQATSSDATDTSLISQATPSAVAIPQPFDTAQLSDTGSNFTSSSCPRFMRTFLANPQFQACVPLSMLLYTSTGFFSLTRSVNWMSITLIVGIVCNYSSSRRFMCCQSQVLWCAHGLYRFEHGLGW